MAGVTTATSDALKRGLFGLFRASRPTLDYFAAYHAKIVTQSGDRKTVDVMPDDSRLPPMGGIPLKLDVPGATVQVAPGAGIMVCFENGDPQRPYATTFDLGATTLTLSISAAKIELGGEGLIPLMENVVIGKTPCQFTGAPHAAMQPLSLVVFAKEAPV